MAGSEVTQTEHLEQLRGTLEYAAVIVEAFTAIFEDDIKVDRAQALADLKELRNCIDSVYVDLDPVEFTEDTGQHSMEVVPKVIVDYDRIEDAI